MTVEISYYDVRLVSLSQCSESEWFRWWFVHGVYNNTRWLHCNELNILLFANRNVVHLQTISNENRATVQLLTPYQESLALLGPWIGVFLGDKDNGNAAPCTLLIVWMLC